MTAHPLPVPPCVVLVVDDESTALTVMARALLSAGYAVHTSPSPREALALAEELPRPVDLVVTDLRMDPMDGTALAELLSARGLASRFLFVSGYGPAVEYNDDLGPFLLKPFSPEQLLSAVSRALV
jgi:DNA-binding NtrC family response regulator